MPEIIASEEIKNYFQTVEQEVNRCYEAANQAREKNLDPEREVNIPLIGIHTIGVVNSNNTTETFTGKLVIAERIRG